MGLFLFEVKTDKCIEYNPGGTQGIFFITYHFKVTVFGAVLKSSTALFLSIRLLFKAFAGKSVLSVMDAGASRKKTEAHVRS